MILVGILVNEEDDRSLVLQGLVYSRLGDGGEEQCIADEEEEEETG